jgi:hypothetical protein
MNMRKELLGFALALAGALIVLVVFLLPSKPDAPIPSLPALSSLGLGILLGAIVVGALLYFRKRGK